MDCCKCDENEGTLTLKDTDAHGDPIDRPICPDCLKEEKECAAWVTAVMGLKNCR